MISQKRKDYKQKWQEENRDKCRAAQQRWRENNRELANERARRSRREHPETGTTYIRNRRRNDPAFRLLSICRKRLWEALKQGNGTKCNTTVELIGCTPEELIVHIETLFSEGMDWENYSLWHIDHIIPCAKFDLADHLQQKQCFHYTNLQPLWALDNIKKGKG